MYSRWRPSHTKSHPCRASRCFAGPSRGLVGTARGLVGPGHPSDEGHGDDEPAEPGDHIEDRPGEIAVRSECDRREREPKHHPARQQHEQDDRADQLAGADGQSRLSIFRRSRNRFAAEMRPLKNDQSEIQFHRNGIRS